MHHVAVQRWPRAILGKQRDLSAMLTALVERFDRLAPCRSLVLVDLSQMKHMSLHRAPAGYTAVFDDALITVLLAVLAAHLVAQKHEARLPKPPAVSQATWSAPHAISAAFLVLLLRFSVTYRRHRTAKFPELPASCESRAKVSAEVRGAGVFRSTDLHGFVQALAPWTRPMRGPRRCRR